MKNEVDITHTSHRRAVFLQSWIFLWLHVSCQAFSFCFLTSPNAGQCESLPGLTMLHLSPFHVLSHEDRWRSPQDHHEEMGIALSHSHFHWQGRICRLPEQSGLSCMVRSTREKWIYLFNIFRYKVKKHEIRTHFAWWAQMYPRSSNTCISTMLLPCQYEFHISGKRGER